MLILNIHAKRVKSQLNKFIKTVFIKQLLSSGKNMSFKKNK